MHIIRWLESITQIDGTATTTTTEVHVVAIRLT